MGQDGQSVYRAPGHPAPEGSQFIRQINAKKREALFAVELPGLVECSDGIYLVSIVPAICVTLCDDMPTRFAVVHFAIRDTNRLTLELAKMDEALEGKPPESFSVRMSSATRTFEEMIEHAESHGGGGCDCGGEGGGAKPSGFPVAAEIRMDPGGRRKTLSSMPLHAAAFALQSRPPRPAAKCYHLFDCHSHWHGVPGFDKWTSCHGPCPPGEICVCDGSIWGPKRTTCDGWDTCWCS